MFNGGMLLNSCSALLVAKSDQCVLWIKRSDLFCMTCSFLVCVLAASCSMFGAYVMSGRMSALNKCVLVFTEAVSLNLCMDVSALLAMIRFVVICCLSVRLWSNVTPRTLLVCVIGIGVGLGSCGFR